MFFWMTLVALALCAQAWGDSSSSLRITPESDGRGVDIVVERVRPGWGLLEVIDPSTGACLRTVHAGTFTPGQQFLVGSDALLRSGSYRIRFREGMYLVVAGQLKRPSEKDPKWVNPTDLALSGPWIYVLDSGLPVQETRPEQLADYQWTPTGGAAVTGKFTSLVDGVLNITLKKDGAAASIKLALLPGAQQETAKKLEQGRQELLAEAADRAQFAYKIDHEGKPDPAFGDHGRVQISTAYNSNIRCLVAEADGKFYVPSGGHDTFVYDAKGVRTAQTIGGWDGDPRGPKCTVWVSSLALGWKNHIYIPNGGYGNGRVYDRTKNGFDGIVCTFNLPDYGGLSNYACADFDGSVYLTGRSNQITKYFDDGKTMKACYKSDPDAKLARPTGGSASAGLIWEACYGPGFGPYWDSGGGGEVVLFWDDGHQIRLIARYGVPGVAADRLEFMNPSAAMMTPDHLELWVSEGGGANAEGPPGNARVRRFLLKANYTEEAPIVLGK